MRIKKFLHSGTITQDNTRVVLPVYIPTLEDLQLALQPHYVTRVLPVITASKPKALLEGERRIGARTETNKKEEFERNKLLMADALTFGMTPHRNDVAALVGASDMANQVMYTLLGEGAFMGAAKGFSYLANLNKPLQTIPEITRMVQDNGKISLSLPSHTTTRPRQIVLEPQGNNKFYVHVRTLDRDHIPANITNEEKQALYNALYEELPDGAEILFPKSEEGYYATRGTVASLKRLDRDHRFTPGERGILLYLDKDGSIKSYKGTSFIKNIYKPKLDWSPDNWFINISKRESYTPEEAERLATHVPEYLQIEKDLFNKGILIKDGDNIIVKGSSISPHEYIMRQSKNFQKMDPGHHFIGVSKGLLSKFMTLGSKFEDAWTVLKNPKSVEGYARQRKGHETIELELERVLNELNLEKDRLEVNTSKLRWATDHGLVTDNIKNAIDKNKSNITELDLKLKSLNNMKNTDPLEGGKVFDITYPKGLKKLLLDAKGARYNKIKLPGMLNYTSTDHLVSSSKGLGYDITQINNVADNADINILMDELIIHKGIPIKSVLGNTGDFFITGPHKYNIYRGIVGITGASLLMDTLNDYVNKQQNYYETYKNGGKPRIHIKPENRGKFTALKNRTGKSATWFKEHGTPALKKMAIFELNSRKWKH